MWMNDVNVEGQSLEERHGVLATHFLEHNSEFIVGNLVNKVALELYNDMVTSENRAESVALVAEEAEAVALEDQWVIEASFYGCLSTHDGEVEHVLETLVANLYSKSESLVFWVDTGRSNLLELNLCLQLFNGLFNDRVLLVEDVNDEFRCIQSEGVSRRVISAKLWRDGRDASCSQNPVRGLTWRCVTEKVMGSANLKTIGWVTLSKNLLEKCELDREGILDQVASDSVEWCHIHVTIRVEVVHKFELVDVLEDEVSHGSGLWLREGEWSGEALRAWVFFSTEISMREAVVAVQINTSICVIAAEPLATPRVVSVLSLHNMIGSLEERLLDIKDSINVQDGNEVESDILE